MRDSGRADRVWRMTGFKFRRPHSSRRALVAASLAIVALLAGACRGIPEPLPPSESIAAGRLPRLAEVFYQRIANRRFNSIATFHDPALREFFESGEAFADYYADLAQALEGARFEANRPLRIVLLEFESGDPGDPGDLAAASDVIRVLIHVHFEGENARPLRWWSTHLERADQWEFRDGSWVIVPGKV